MYDVLQELYRCLKFVLLFTLQAHKSHKGLIFAVIFILMTVLILYGSNNSNETLYPPFHMATNDGIKTTDLKKWAGKDGYVPLHGNKVLEVEPHKCFWNWNSSLWKIDFNISLVVDSHPMLFNACT